MAVSSSSEVESTIQMAILRMLWTIFVWPGDSVRRWLGMTEEQDGGLVRAFVNQVFWGAVAFFVAYRYFI